MNAPQPQGGPALHAKKGRGCMIALAVVGGVIFLTCAAVAFAVWRFAISERGKKIVSTVSTSVQVANDAQHAPGTKELRALGCAQALVIDAQHMQTLVNVLGVDAGAPVDPKLVPMVVTCKPMPWRTAPSCAQVAETYVKAVGGHAPGTFVVSVIEGAGSAAVCNESYGADGTRLEAR